jgi:hypothetical protein
MLEVAAGVLYAPLVQFFVKNCIPLKAVQYLCLWLGLAVEHALGARHGFKSRSQIKPVGSIPTIRHCLVWRKADAIDLESMKKVRLLLLQVP